MSDYVLLIGCGKDKAKVRCPARSLYKGVLTGRAIAWADRSGLPYCILSAKHGCLDPTREIDPYELKLSSLTLEDRKRWGRRVSEVLRRKFPSRKFLAFAGSEYLEYLDIGEVIDPMKGLGVGQRIAWLNAHPSLSDVIGEEDETQQHPMRHVCSHFLDSGSFTLWEKSEKYAEKNRCSVWDYYDTDDFWSYIDAYADFVTKNGDGIDHYANVDAIPNPEITWRNQQYLESKGLHPVPVIHYRTDLMWLEKYIDAGYDFLAIGGLVGSTSQDKCRYWLDAAFDVICRGPQSMPRVKVHGFGVTALSLFTRYPWWSVDSTSWVKCAAFGNVCVPKKRKGEFVFTEPPSIVTFSEGSPSVAKGEYKHFKLLSPSEKGIVEEWLAFVGVSLGKSEAGIVVENGVTNHYGSRAIACLKFFQMLSKQLPEWPWPFRSKQFSGGFFS